ncbi:MAG: type III pantothenate kinase [Halobacteriovoraceae bacterium]|nr:type III pantothenate kinase [Halobacteriovoraceae bacterium]
MESLELETFFEKLPKTDLHTFDVGNTRIKHGFFKKGNFSSEDSLSSIKEIQEVHLGKPNIITSVKREIKSTFSHEFKDNLFFDMPVHYGKSLGHDRLISSYLAFHWIKEEVLILDCGTFITLDLVNPDGFQGGFILPGIKTLGESYPRGDQLFEPDTTHLFSENSSERKNFPNSTMDAMTGGHTLIIEGLIERIQSLSKGRKILVTGGGAELFQKHIKNTISCPNLLHYSMYFQYVKNHL